MSNVGFRVYTKINRPSKELVEQFKGLPVANIADEMNRLSCMDACIKPLNSTPLLGTAFTVKARVGDNLMLHTAIDMAQPGEIIIVDDQGDTANSLIGENMMLWAERRGISGMVIDGAVRDVETLSQMKFPVYATGVQPNGPYKDGPGEINVPVCCGGITVNPGDIIVGDADGVVVIKAQDAPVVLEKAKAKLKQELATREAIANGTWNRSKYTLDALRKLGCEIIDDVYKS
ncbi:MAG: 4-carboxy-4-hydroxy-2-oxoadipate aldolase/oxaloacetate decarboxylase [Negativicutes bacterium]|nr:4-carboxy-4-hydroxy-2-oxoadipate aldolase/oxaloacetate decarboxylase [Negativicutes bacterium]